MTLQEQIIFFKKAKRYYSRWNIFKRGSNYGVCIFMLERKEYFPGLTKGYSTVRGLLNQYRTTPKYRGLFFNNHKERREAINKVLENLKSQL